MEEAKKRTPEVRIKPTRYRDLDATACFRRFQKEKFLLAGIAILLVTVTAAVFIGHTEERSLGLYCLILVAILLIYLIVLVRHTLNLFQILYTDCDPIKFMALMDKFIAKLKRASTKSAYHLYCAMAASYLEDWDKVYRELDQSRGSRSRAGNAVYTYLNLLGDYYLAKGRRAEFDDCKQQLLSLAERAKPSARATIDAVLLTWERRTACMEGDYEKERELLEQMLVRYKKTLIQEVIWNFRLAQLDLLANDTQCAKTRLRFVVQYGNTLPAHTLAEKLLDETGD